MFHHNGIRLSIFTPTFIKQIDYKKNETMVTKGTDDNPAAGSNTSAFQPQENSILFLKKTPAKSTLSPTDTAVKVATDCIKFLPKEMQTVVNASVLEIFNSHHRWRVADAKHTDHANDPNYLPQCAKWKSNLQPSKRVIHTVGYKSVEASLNKVVDQCKAKYREAAIALERMDRDDKRNHTISLVWKLLMKLTSSVIKLGLKMEDDVKPDQKLVIQVLLKTIRDNVSCDGMFGCHWGHAFKVLEEITKCTNTLISDPHFVVWNIGDYTPLDDDGDQSDLEKPYIPIEGTQKAKSGAKLVDASTMTDPPPSDTLDDVRKKLTLNFQVAKTSSTMPTEQDPNSFQMSMHFALRNRKTEIVNVARYNHSLKVHVEKLLNNLVLEEDDTDGTAVNASYTHRGVLVTKNSTVRSQKRTNTNTTQNGATSIPTQPNTGESTLTLTTTPTTTSTAASTAAASTRTSTATSPATVNAIEETPDAPATQKNPYSAHPSSNSTGGTTDAEQGETVENTGRDSAEARPMKDPLSDIASPTLEGIVISISDAYNGLIHKPYLAYVEAVKHVKDSVALVESFIESDYIEKTEDALELVHKDERVTPPVLNETIRKQVEPVKKDVATVRMKTMSLMSKTQRKNLKLKEAKKRKKPEESASGVLMDDSEDDVEAGTDTEQQRKKKKPKKKQPKKQPKNSDSHPEPAPSVTQKKKNQKAKNGKGKQKNGKKKGNEPTSTMPSQQNGRNSKKQSKKKNGGK